MRFFIFFSFLFVDAFKAHSETHNQNEAGTTVGQLSSRNRRSRGVGGANTLIILYPYHATLEYRNQIVCQGAVISSHLVVTVAHCILEDVRRTVVRAGTDKRNYGGTWHAIVEFIRHDNFTFVPNDGYDIALVRVREAFKTSDHERPIPMFRANERVEPDDMVMVSTFGGSDVRLQQLTMPVIETVECRRLTITTPPAGTFCTGVQDNSQRTCHGDAGAPVVLHDRLVGLVSYGIDCNHPTIHTNIAYFQNWINLFKL